MVEAEEKGMKIKCEFSYYVRRTDVGTLSNGFRLSKGRTAAMRAFIPGSGCICTLIIRDWNDIFLPSRIPIVSRYTSFEGH